MQKKSLPILPLFSILFLILCPLGFVNLIWNQTQKWDKKRHEEKQEDEARRVLETLTQGWRVRDFLEQTNGLLHQRIEEIIAADSQKVDWSGSFGPNLLKEQFAPISSYSEFAVFSYPNGNSEEAVVVFSSPRLDLGKRLLAKSFQFLVKSSLNQPPSMVEKKLGKQLLQYFFGDVIQVDSLGKELSGIPLKVLFRKEPFFLIWDVVYRQGKPCLGYIHLVPETPDVQKMVMEKALDISARELNSYSRLLGKGYLRFYPSEIGDIITTPANEGESHVPWGELFRNGWNLEKLEATPLSSSQFILSSQIVFFQVIPEFSHVGAVVFGKIKNSAFPQWLFLLNLSVTVSLLLLLVRGGLMGAWPKIGLSVRFAGFYFLAVAVPLMLCFSSARAYLEINRETLLGDLKRNIINDLISIDLGKSRCPVFYKSAINNMLHDPDLRETFFRDGLKDSTVIGKATQFLRAKEGPLPFKAFFLVDGKGQTLYRYAKPNWEENLKSSVRFFRAAMIRWIWRSAESAGENPGEEPLNNSDKTFLEMYSTAGGISLENMIGDFRGIPGNVARDQVIKIHDFFNVNGVDRVGIFVAWRNQDMERGLLAKAQEIIKGRYPGAEFLAFRKEHGRIVSLVTDSSKDSIPLDDRFSKQIRESHFEGDALTVVIPSRQNDKSFYFVRVSVKNILESLRWKKLMLDFIMLLSAACAAFLFWWTSRRTVLPIRHLERSIQGMAAGELEHRVDLVRSDELGDLAQAFNEMVEGLKKRRRVSALISHKALEDITRFKNVEESAKGYRTQAVVLVSDIRGFTTMSETWETMDVVSLLNRHFEEASETIGKMGGRIDKFIGDAVQAIFEEHPDDEEPAAVRAVQAGINLLMGVNAINQERNLLGLFPYTIGIGISSGELLVGGLGETNIRFDYAVMGVPLKEATQLESLSKLAPEFPLIASIEVASSSLQYRECFIPLAGHEETARVLSQSLLMSSIGLIGGKVRRRKILA